MIVADYLLGLLKEMWRSQTEIGDRIWKIRPDSYTRRFNLIIEKYGLPKVRFHDLRHYHASWLYAQGYPDQYAADRLGHDVRILKGIYQHLQLDRKTALDNRIRAINRPKPVKSAAQNAAQKTNI